MTRFPAFPASLRTLLVTVVAFMLLAMGSAQVRETVLVRMQEEGFQRIYETDATTHQPAASRVSQLRMGRKPLERRVRPQRPLTFAGHDLATTRARGPHGARAPPHAPRAPPAA